MSEYQKVTTGRIVHYVLPDSYPCAGEIRPAIVVRPWQQLDHPTNPGMSNLQVFLDGSNDAADRRTNETMMWAGSVSYSEEPKPNTWHWPPRT